MSVADAGHREPGAEVVDLSRRRREKVERLLDLRSRLAVLAVMYDAHNIDGAVDLARRMSDVETDIRALDPWPFEASESAWLDRDVKLAHDPNTPSPECQVCRSVREPNPWDLDETQSG